MNVKYTITGRQVFSVHYDRVRRFLDKDLEWKDKEINQRNFPVTGRGIVQFTGVLFHFVDPIFPSVASREILKAGWENAGVEHGISHVTPHDESVVCLCPNSDFYILFPTDGCESSVRLGGRYSGDEMYYGSDHWSFLAVKPTQLSCKDSHVF